MGFVFITFIVRLTQKLKSVIASELFAAIHLSNSFFGVRCTEFDYQQC